jgi:D-3-phosphoglycerate dehydrogenase
MRETPMRAVFVDASETLAAVARRLLRPDDPPFAIHADPGITPQDLPAILDGAEIAVIDHTALPGDVARACAGLKHVVFLGTGARSYMDPEALAAERGIAVHTIKGYGDTAVAECAFALMWAAARGLPEMDRAMRAGSWLRTEGIQLTGKTVGLVGFGGIAAEMARLCRGHPDVAFVALEHLLAESDVVSLHLLLTDETRGFLSAARIAAMKPGAMLINTARGAVLDEAALVEALRSGHVARAGLDVFTVEPLPADHPLAALPNVTLSAHSAFRTPEASDNLIGAALDHCRRIAAG